MNQDISLGFLARWGQIMMEAYLNIKVNENTAAAKR
jgi:hypothetical protein